MSEQKFSEQFPALYKLIFDEDLEIGLPPHGCSMCPFSDRPLIMDANISEQI